MIRFIASLFLAAALGTAAGVAAAADVAKGEALHKDHCISCHDALTGGKPNSLYTRKDRRVTTLKGLKKQVKRCELSLGLRWFDDDVANVAEYLNKTYYRFGP